MSTLANESADLIRPLTELPPLEAVVPTRQLLDTAVRETRAKAPSAAAEGRRVDRLSVDEMNDLSLDDIRERFIKSSTDTRGPMETVLDWIDAPRNLIMSSLAPGLRRRAEERGEKGTFGLGRVHASDVLEEMGVEQPIVRGVLGFIGDVAFDPLTYIGPPAKGAQLAAKGAQGATSAYTLTKTGRNALLRGIDEVAKTGQSADAEIGKYLTLASAERGLKPGADTKDLLASHVLGELYTPTLREAGAEAVQGRPLAAVGKAYDATVERLLRPVGGSVEFTGSALARDIERVDEVGDAARDVLRKYGEYLSEPGLRIGVKQGQASTRVAHIPFTDKSLSVPQFMPNAHALKTQAVANAVRDGSIDTARLLPQSAQVLLRNEQIAGNVGEQMDAAEAYLRERAALEAMSDDDFMPPPSGQGPPTPPPAPGGPPSPGPALPGGGTTTPPAVRSPEQIAADLRLKSQVTAAKNQTAGATLPSERGAGNAVNVKGAATAAEPSAAASRATGRIDSQPLPPIKTREQLINELHTAFAEVPKQARDDFIKLVDARARKLKVLPDDYWAKKFAEFRKGLPESGRTLEQGPLYQAFTHHGTPWVFEPSATVFDSDTGSKAVVPLDATMTDPDLSRKLAEGRAKIERVHKYGKFRKSAIGSGEGHQAFSYGHYSAEELAIADRYRIGLSQRHFVRSNGALVKKDDVIQRIKEALANNPDGDEIAKDVGRWVRDSVGSLHRDVSPVAIQDEYINWYHKLGELYPELIGRFEQQMSGAGTDVSLSRLLRSVKRGEKSTGSVELDRRIRSLITTEPWRADALESIAPIIRGLEDVHSKPYSRLEIGNGGPRSLDDLPEQDSAAATLLEIQAGLQKGKTPAEKLKNAIDHYAGVSKAQEDWIDFYTRSGASQLRHDDAMGAKSLLDEALDTARTDANFGRVQYLKSEFNVDDIASGAMPSDHIADIIKSHIKNDADAVLRSDQWREFERLTVPAHAQSRLNEANRWKAEADSVLSFAERHKPRYVEIKPPGALYKTSVLPSDDEFILWDKTIGEQSPIVRSALRQLVPSKVAPAGMIDDMRADAAYAYLSNTSIDGGPPSNARASELLYERGVRGTKYLDGSSRGGVGNPSYNYVVFNDDDIEIVERLYQRGKGGKRGAITFLEDRRAVLSALENPNESTLIHELGHSFRQELVGDDLLAVERHYKIKPGSKWSRPMEERYARDFERYLATGKAPTRELAGVFERFKEWLQRIYIQIVGTPLEQKLTPTMRKHFDSLFKADDGVDATTVVKPALREGAIIGSKTAVVDRIESLMPFNTEELVESWFTQANRIMNGGFEAGEQGSIEQLSTGFANLPGEVKEWLDGLPYPQEAKIKGMFKERPGAKGGEDAMATLDSLGMGRYFDAIELLYGSPALRARVLLKHSPPSAERDFYESLLDSFMGGRAGGREAVTFTDLDVGSTFTINGHPGIIVEDELGRKFLRHPNGDDVSAESLGRFAIDRGTLSVLNQSDAARVADEINPNPHAKYGSEFGDTPALADDGGPSDLPFSPGPFFQGGDIPNQSGLFGQGNVGPSGEKQGGLFGDMSKQPEPPQADPMARREGESIEDWKIRTKFAKAERNTGTLFQDDGDALFPKDKALKDLDDQYRMQSAAIVQAARQSFEEVEAIVKGMDAASYAQSPQTVEAALQLRQKYEEASVTYRRAQAVAETTQNLARQLKIVGDKDKETILRELAPLGEDLADRIYEIASTDPEAASKIADMAQLSMSTAALNAEMLRSQFIKFASAPDRALSAYAMNVLGTDNRQLARTAFRTMADAARRMGVSNDGRLIGLLNQMDESSRRVFGIRGGYVQKGLADIGAEARGVYNESLRWQHTLESRVRDAVSEKLPPDQFDQALRIVYGIMHELVDPGQSGFNWFRKSADGPQGLSAMAELLQKAKSDGVFAKAYPKLREVAMQSVSDIRQLGDSEIGDQILDYLMTHHVPIVPTDEGGRAMLEMNLARNATSGGKGRGVQPFQMRRTTHQRYFQGPDGKWRWYYGFDEHLPNLRGQLFDADGSPLPTSVVARELDVPEDVAAQYQQAVEAQDVWAQMVADNPGVEKDFPWKPTDAYELNELFHGGRMRALVGSSKDPKDLFDTRASIVQGARMAMHQRAVSQKKLANIVDRNLLAFPSKDKLFESAKEVGRVVKTKTGVDAKVVGLENSSLGGFVPVFEIGGERYRALDPKVRSGFIGRLLPEMADRGVMRSDVADLVEKVADLTRGDNVWPIIRFADHLQGLWKKTTLFNPSWTVNDTLGNITLALSGGARVRDMTKHAPAVYRLRSLLHNPDKAASMTIKLGDGRTVNGLDLLHILVQKRIFENTLPAEVAAKLVQENPSILSKPQSYLDSVFGWNLRFNSFTQDQMRGMAFMSHLEQGADVESAALKTIQSMMDWSDFTRVEQQVFRRLMPFYSWMRNNLGYQLYLLLNDPKWAAAVPKLKESLEQSFAGDAVVPEQDRPGWMREALATQLSANPDKRFGMMFSQALPAGDLFQFMLPLVGVEGAMKFAHAMGSSVSPLLKVPLEVGAGEEFFSGRTIGPDAFSADLSIGEYATNQIAPLNTVRKTGEALGRSGTEAAARLAFGGRIQAMDDARLASSLERQDRDKERRLRGAITRAERRGDADTVAEARARLLRLYQNRMDRGAKVPDWAVGALQEMNAVE